MPGRFSLYQDMTVEENLTFFATVFGTTIRENYHLIKDIYSQIEPFKDRKAGALSGGMKQKLALSCALIHKPSVLFLDEPTTGVDPVSRKELWEMLRQLKQQGITMPRLDALHGRSVALRPDRTNPRRSVHRHRYAAAHCRQLRPNRFGPSAATICRNFYATCAQTRTSLQPLPSAPATMSPPMGNRPNRNCAIIFPDWATTMSKSRRSGPESRIVT